jgi:hypothetical protein
MIFIKKHFFRLILADIIVLACLPASLPVHGAGVETVCAEVQIRLSQRVTFEREAFEASLVVTNGTGILIENLAVSINFADANGNAVPFATSESSSSGALFFVRPQPDSWNPALQSSVSGGDKKEARWLIVPAPGAAGATAQGAVYVVGATITYTFGGEVQTVHVIPDNILVRPMPSLLFQYFLPGEIPGIDPADPAPAPDKGEPFHFALRIVNRSPFASARKVKVESNQPEIIVNESALPLDLKIIGTRINGQAISPGLLADFGDIAPASSASAWWTLASNIAGRFIDVTGEITHSLDLGGALTSLVEPDVPIVRRLLGMVVVDLPGHDSLPDILATPQFDGTIGTVTIHESDNDVISEAVTHITSGDSRLLFSADGRHLAVAGLAANLVYVRVPGKIAELRTVTALRSDGKLLPRSNVWISRSLNPGGGWNYWFNLFDTAKGANDTYSFSYGSGAAVDTEPVITFAPAGPAFTLAVEKPFSLTIEAAAAGQPLDISAGSLPAGSLFAKNEPGRYTFSWTPGAAWTGNFNVRFTAKNGTQSTARSALLTVRSGSLYINTWSDWWRHYRPDITADPDPQADINHNGLSNLLEYALDLDPVSGDLEGQPVPGMAERGGKRYLTLTWRLRTGDAALVATPQVSGNLFSWENLTVDPEPVGEPFYSRTGEVQEWRVVDGTPLPENGQGRFIRLAIRLNQETGH